MNDDITLQENINIGTVRLNINVQQARLVDFVKLGTLVNYGNLLVNGNLAELQILSFESSLNKSYNSAVNNLINQAYDTIKTLLEQASRYDEYFLNQNLEDIYAREQGWVRSWGNSIAKTGVNFVGSAAQVLGSILSVVYGLKNGNVDSIFNNLLTKAIDDTMAEINNKFLTYQSDYDKANLWLSLFNLFDSGASTLLQGASESLGFSLGTITGIVAEDVLIGALTGGVGEILLIAAQVKKFTQMLTRIDKVEDVGKAVMQLNKALTLSIFNGSKAYGIARQIIASTAEAKIEALETEKNLQGELEKEYFDKNGYSLTGEELNKISTYSKDAARQRFIANTALLTITNQIQFLNLFKEFNFSKRFLSKADDVIVNTLGDNVDDLTKLAVRAALKTVLQKSASYGKSILGKFAISEGVEEGLQFAADKTVSDYARQKLKDKNSASLVLSSLNGLKETVGTEEGWKNIVTGIIGGGISAGVFKLADIGAKAYKREGLFEDNNRLQKEKEISLVNDAFNYKSMFGTFADKVKDANVIIEAENNASDAVNKNNRFEFEQNKNLSILNYTLTALRNNQYDGSIMQVEELGKLTGRIKLDETGIELTTLLQEISKVKQKMALIKKIYDNVETKFSGKKYSTLEYKMLKEELIYQHFSNIINLQKANTLKNSIASRFGSYDNLLEGLMNTVLISYEEDKDGYSYFFLKYNIKSAQKLIDDLDKEIELEKELGVLGLEYKKELKKKEKFRESIQDTLDQFGKYELNGNREDIFDSFKELTDDGSILDDELQDYFQELFDSKKYIANANRAINKYNALLTEKGQVAFIDNIKELEEDRKERLKKIVEDHIKKSQEKLKSNITDEEEILEEEDEDIILTLELEESTVEQRELRSLTKEQEIKIKEAFKIEEETIDLNDKVINSIILAFKTGDDWLQLYIKIADAVFDFKHTTYKKAFDNLATQLLSIKNSFFSETDYNKKKSTSISINLKVKDILHNEYYLEIILLETSFDFIDNNYSKNGFVVLYEAARIQLTDYTNEDIENEFKDIFDRIRKIESSSLVELEIFLLVVEAVEQEVEIVILKLELVVLTESLIELVLEETLQLKPKSLTSLKKLELELIITLTLKETLELEVEKEELVQLSLSLFVKEEVVIKENMDIMDQVINNKKRTQSTVNEVLSQIKDSNTKEEKELLRQKNKTNWLEGTGCK